ncbi:hypothetical protein FPV67DRAFT_92367 [Lyophyllum atratum]|nr:hypothetical protein FPV67DRAFT_92367 [Lyophyllum atratum]
MPRTATFFLLTAFTTSANGGNPAAIVFTDMDLPLDTFKTIAQNLNQPITMFLSSSPLPSKTKNAVAFDVRWFTAHRQELPLCGHGTLAAAKVIFENKAFVNDDTEIIEFYTPEHGVTTARRREGGLYEIQLPSTTVVELSAEERVRITKLLTRTFGREVGVNFLGTGGKGFEHYLLIELDEKEDIRNIPVNASPLRESGFAAHVVTTQSSSGNETFVSRMFAPGYVQNDEDPVCGSAHCLMAPYWYTKLGIPSGQAIMARQVSPRGGELRLVWQANKAILKLMGQVRELGKGELVIE